MERFKRLRRLAAILVLPAIAAAATVQAQEATERYIPIGQSPGLSYEHTYIGPIDSVNLDERRMTMKTDSGMHSIRITDRTRIWLDRSEQKKTNLTGDPADCKPGRIVEVKFMDPETREVADWIKVKVAEP